MTLIPGSNNHMSASAGSPTTNIAGTILTLRLCQHSRWNGCSGSVVVCGGSWMRQARSGRTMVHQSNLLSCVVGVLLFCVGGHAQVLAGGFNALLQTHGPLRQSTDNSRYFADADNRIVYVTGSHTWENFQDVTEVFDYPAYLDRLTALHHNFIRLWVTESIHSDGGWLLNPPANEKEIAPPHIADWARPCSGRPGHG